MSGPDLRWTSEPPDPAAVALVLHGGAENSFHHVRWYFIAVQRLRPVAEAIARAAGDDVAVVRLKFGVLGWNGDLASPIPDARWALDRVRATYPGTPIVVVGHSMGGRTALQVAAEPDIAAVAALAPWVEPGDPVHAHPGEPFLLLHGTRDRITSLPETRRRGEMLRAAGADATFEPVPWAGHAFVTTWRRTHRRVGGWVADVARGLPRPNRPS